MKNGTKLIIPPVVSIIAIAAVIAAGVSGAGVQVFTALGAVAALVILAVSLLVNRGVNKKISALEAMSRDAEFLENERNKLLKAVTESDSALEKGELSLIGFIEALENGDFSVSEFEGEGEVSVRLNALKRNLKNVADSVKGLEKDCRSGNLNERIDVSELAGDWKSMAESLNCLIETMTAPVLEATEVLQRVADGDLSVKMSGDYSGDNALIKNAVNLMTERFSTYISDISETLLQMSKNNLDVEIAREYIGDFVVIKDSINEIVRTLNMLIGDVYSASDMVATGARQISDTSNTLHVGTLQQSNAVSELTELVEELYNQTQKNAENSIKADELSESAKGNAEMGNAEMKHMLDSMSAINESSTNISKIIKVIEDIAFQTNLLALNASVEAARAGEHGKGFAVVAEEVRNLSGRTQEAVKETTSLIQTSITKVNEGTVTAKKTADALDKIVSVVASVSDIIEDIAKASKEQEENIGRVNEGIRQISEVTTTNSFTAQESAAASEELSGQSEVLKGTFAGIKLKRQIQSLRDERKGVTKGLQEPVQKPVESAVAGTGAAKVDKPAKPAVTPKLVSKPVTRPVSAPAKPVVAPEKPVLAAKPAPVTKSAVTAKPVTKPVVTPAKSEVSPEKPVLAAKPAPAAKPVAKPATTPAKPAPAAKPVAKPAAKPAPAAKPVTKPAATPAKPALAAKPVTKPAATPTKPAPAAKPVATPVKPAPAAKPVTKPTLQGVQKETFSNPAVKKTERPTAARAGKREEKPVLSPSRQNVNYNSADVAIFDNKDFGKY